MTKAFGKYNNAVSVATSILEFVTQELALGAHGFTLRNSAAPLIYRPDGVRVSAGLLPSEQEIEAALRHFISSRETRRYRADGVLYFRTSLANTVMIGGIRRDGDFVRLELRRIVDQSTPAELFRAPNRARDADSQVRP